MSAVWVLAHLHGVTGANLDQLAYYDSSEPRHTTVLGY